MYSFWPGSTVLLSKLFDQRMLSDVTLNCAAMLCTVSLPLAMYIWISLFDLNALATICGLATKLSEVWVMANSAFCESAWLVTAVASGKFVTRATLTAMSADES